MTTKQNSRRTENISVNFSDDLANGWAFDVPEAFRRNLDIIQTRIIDKIKNIEKERELGRKLKPDEKLYRYPWTEGNPPAYSFSVGHVFYDPPGVRSMIWAAALQILRRVDQVKQATPDPGALLTSELLGEDVDSIGSTKTGYGGKSGWVEFEVIYYQYGKILRSETKNLSQNEFANFLRTGIYL